MSAISLTKEDLDISSNKPTFAILVYIIQIVNSLYGTVIACIGILQRSRLDMDVASWNIKHLTVAPFLLGSMMLLNGTFNFVYMQDAFEHPGQPVDDHTKNLSTVILVVLTLIATMT